jgi:hypothetical protein
MFDELDPHCIVCEKHIEEEEYLMGLAMLRGALYAVAMHDECEDPERIRIGLEAQLFIQSLPVPANPNLN